jgi:hypothetical protein
VAPEAQLEWEARVGRPAAAAAFASALLPLLGGVFGAPRGEELGEDTPSADYLIALDERSGQALGGAIIGGIGLALLGVVFWYLWRCIKARRPEFPRVALVVALIGPLVLATAGVLSTIDRIDTAESYVAELPESQEVREAQAEQLDERAEDELDDESGTIRGVAAAGYLALAISLVMFGLWAMRTGLMSRFMGSLGIVIGAFYGLAVLLPTGAPQLVQFFWAIALGFLFLGRWPGGRGPAWETGEAVPWPSAMEQQRRAAEQAEAEKAAASDGHGDLEAASVDPDTPQETHPRSKKRKRKRRR